MFYCVNPGALWQVTAACMGGLEMDQGVVIQLQLQSWLRNFVEIALWRGQTFGLLGVILSLFHIFYLKDVNLSFFSLIKNSGPYKYAII